MFTVQKIRKHVMDKKSVGIKKGRVTYFEHDVTTDRRVLRTYLGTICPIRIPCRRIQKVNMVCIEHETRSNRLASHLLCQRVNGPVILTHT